MKYYEIWINDTTMAKVSCFDRWEAYDLVLRMNLSGRSKVKILEL
jgi:hypothetical protein